jgi:PAS domain S-box-containing protein
MWAAAPSFRLLKISSGILVLAMIVAMGAGWWSWCTEWQRMESELQRQAGFLSQSFDTELKLSIDSLQQTAFMIAHDPRIDELLRQAAQAHQRLHGTPEEAARLAELRKALYAIVQPIWLPAQQQFGLRQLHFHLGPGDTSLLRVHKPQSHGDDLSDVRPTIVTAMREGRPTGGFELGRVYAGIRGVVPVVTSNEPGAEGTAKYGAAVEVGRSFAGLLEVFKTTFGGEMAVLTDEQIIRRVMWRDFVADWFATQPPIAGYGLEHSTSPEVAPLLTATAVQHIARHGGCSIEHINGRWLAVQAFPLRDFAGNEDPTRPPVGAVLNWKSVDRQVAAIRQGALADAVRGGGGSILAAIVGMILVRLGQRQMRTAVQRQTSMLSGLLDSIPDLVFFKDESGRYLGCNPAFMEFVGRPRDQIIGCTDYDLFAEEVAKEFRAHDRRVMDQNEARQNEEWVAYPDGRRVLLETRKAPLRTTADEPVGILGVSRDMTERRAAEMARRESDERLRRIAAQVPGVVYQFLLRPDGSSCFPYASAGIKEIYGVEPEQVCDDASPVFNVLHDDDQALVRQSIYESAGRLAPWHCEYRVRAADGSVRWLEGHASPQRRDDGSVLWHGFISDITARKRINDELLHQKALLDRIIHHAPIGIWLAAGDGSYPILNRTFARWVGWDRGSTSMTKDERHACMLSDRAAAETDGPFHAEEWLTFADGRRHCLQVIKTALFDQNGHPLGVLGLGLDITEQKEADAQRARLVDELTDARARAEAANHTKSRFLANMSHEIRTPMTAILGYVDLLSSGQCTDVQHNQFLQVIKRNGTHLLAILNDILDLSKIECGKMQIEQVETHVDSVIEQVASLMRVRAMEKGLSLRVSYDPVRGIAVMTDPVRLRQILMNLAGNAIKFTHQGLITIDARWIPGEKQRGMLEITVEDSGIGMSDEQLAQLFRPFSQADSSTTREFGGTGLGLTISGRLAEMLGGTITVESRPGKGSRFVLSLEVAFTAHRKKVDAATQSLPKQRQPLSERPTGQILVAEDGPDNQELIAMILRQAGWDVDLVENGRAAVDQALKLSKDGTPYAVILMDMQMPILDGYAATAELRRAGYQHPIIALTAHAMSGDRQRCLDAGCDEFATKPIDVPALLSLIQELAARKRAAHPMMG